MYDLGTIQEAQIELQRRSVESFDSITDTGCWLRRVFLYKKERLFPVSGFTTSRVNTNENPLDLVFQFLSEWPYELSSNVRNNDY